MNKIKILLKTIALSAVLFIVIFMLTSKEKAHVDGLNEYGFPFRYYVYSYNEIEAYKSVYGFKPALLLIDIAILVIPVFSMFYYLDKRT